MELFPARVRYTSLSIPYHLGNGLFGGGVPLFATALVARMGSTETTDYAGLIYSISVALMTVVVGYFALRETHHIRIWDEVSEATPATGDRPTEVVVDKTRPREAT